MAFLDYTENFWFPSQTGTYTLPSGDTLRICIYYDRASADANTDTDAELEKLTPLDIPLEVSSSAQSHRFSSIQFSFINIDNVFETESILLDAKKNETFCDIYFNGSLYWRGLVEFNQTKKDKWYIDSGSLKYRIIKVKAYDVMSYFWKNAKTLNDASYANAQSIKTVLEGVLGLAGFAAGDLNIDTSIDINELCGTSYDLSTLKCNGFGTSMLCSTFLKSFMMYFGAFIFHLKGKMNIVSRVAGTTVSVGNDNIVKLKNIENKNAI